MSVYDTLEAAREVVLRFPRIGRFIAELFIAEDGPIRFAQTGDDPNHFDLWGAPEDILKAVGRVVPA